MSDKIGGVKLGPLFSWRLVALPWQECLIAAVGKLGRSKYRLGLKVTVEHCAVSGSQCSPKLKRKIEVSFRKKSLETQTFYRSWRSESEIWRLKSIIVFKTKVKLHRQPTCLRLPGSSSGTSKVSGFNPAQCRLRLQPKTTEKNDTQLAGQGHESVIMPLLGAS